MLIINGVFFNFLYLAYFDRCTGVPNGLVLVSTNVVHSNMSDRVRSG